MRAPSTFHSSPTSLLPSCSNASATSAAVCASIGATGERRVSSKRASPSAPSSNAACATAPRRCAYMAARRTSATGTCAAFAIASIITPPSAPCLSSPSKSRKMKSRSPGVARAVRSRRRWIRRCVEPGPRMEASSSNAASRSPSVSVGRSAGDTSTAARKAEYCRPILPCRVSPDRYSTPISISAGSNARSACASSRTFAVRNDVPATRAETSARVATSVGIRHWAVGCSSDALALVFLLYSLSHFLVVTPLRARERATHHVDRTDDVIEGARGSRLVDEGPFYRHLVVPQTRNRCAQVLEQRFGCLCRCAPVTRIVRHLCHRADCLEPFGLRPQACLRVAYGRVGQNLVDDDTARAIDPVLFSERDQALRAFRCSCRRPCVRAQRRPAQEQPRPFVLMARLDDATLDAGCGTPLTVEEFEHETAGWIDETSQREFDDFLRQRRPHRLVIERHPLKTCFQQMHV